MTIFQALVLGVLQGFAEFLPISSSAHLALAPWLFGWRDPGLAFDVALHVGTLVAVLWYFRAEWWKLTRAALDAIRRLRVDTPDAKRVVFLIVATIPAALIGPLLKDLAESAFRAPALTASALMAMGVILWYVDRMARQDRALGAMTWIDAALIGMAQVLALVPGVSRSGSTMTMGRALRLDRESAAIFSFLMSMPAIAGAAVIEVPKALREHGLGAPLIAGVLAAAVSSWLAIAVLLRYLARHSFGVFAIYRLALGAIVLIILAVRG